MANKNNNIIVITGGIASGKSSVSQIICEHGYKVICSDTIAHQVTQKGKKGALLIRKHFGPTVFNKSGQLDRKKLAEIIFTKPKAKKKLETLLHPLIRDEIQKQINKAPQNKPVFLDIPLYFETKGKAFYKPQAVICVYANQNIRIDRLKKDRGYTRKEALDRIHSQMDLREKCHQSDFVIKNNSTLTDLKRQVEQILISITA